MHAVKLFCCLGVYPNSLRLVGAKAYVQKCCMCDSVCLPTLRASVWVRGLKKASVDRQWADSRGVSLGAEQRTLAVLLVSGLSQTHTLLMIV